MASPQLKNVLNTLTERGATAHVTISAASTNATSVKAATSRLIAYECFNQNTSVRYLKLYNKASAPTVGTDTPIKVIAIPGSGGANLYIDKGVKFDTGLAFAITTGAAHTDTGAVAANEIQINLDYV